MEDGIGTGLDKIYLLAMRTIYRFEKRKLVAFIEEEALLYTFIER